MFTRRHVQSAGFMPPAARVLGRERRNVAIAQLVATIALAICTILAVTVVSAGIAHADVVGNVIDNESSLFAIALLLGLLFIGMGGLTILSLPHPHRHKKTHS
jgi:threonine/homoserine/homoserine lactone efflux protein